MWPGLGPMMMLKSCYVNLHTLTGDVAHSEDYLRFNHEVVGFESKNEKMKLDNRKETRNDGDGLSVNICRF